jgi:hypothetical protein
MDNGDYQNKSELETEKKNKVVGSREEAEGLRENS